MSSNVGVIYRAISFGKNISFSQSLGCNKRMLALRLLAVKANSFYDFSSFKIGVIALHYF